ncbi:DUF1800 domain-containing protein [Ottowia thiooxydans]|uniref:DUF1800 domain-containing protein n=1 Tax=Ottowia thiooxydans TaxID=219182 RepID=UPI0004152FF0|nr:DUF1800 domain-containing protein [Ottowia thiooxydans]
MASYLLIFGSAAAETQSADADAWRALSRLGYGPTPALVEQVQRAGGARSWALGEIDRASTASHSPAQIDVANAEFNAPLPEIFSNYRSELALRREIRAQEQASSSAVSPAPEVTAVANPARNYSNRVARQAASWRLASCSQPDTENPLLARLTEFWFNHLNVSSDKGIVKPFVGHYVLHAIRRNVLGRFDELLLASGRHPAMLYYLDQTQSVADGTTLGQQRRGLNENYARELMELHTLGVNGGYTQRDVRELARILTGWAVAPQQPEGFRFVPRLHDTQAKTLLGRTFAAAPSSAGETEGLAAIRLLSEQTATAQRIALRLAQWFVADQPPQALVDQLARSFQTSQGDLRTVMRTLVASRAFWDPANKLFKTPYDYVCSVLAATGGAHNDRDISLALGALNGAGQGIHRWPTPDGYKSDTATWLAPEALTRRADYAMAIARKEPPVDYLAAFVQPATMQRINAQPPKLRAGLMLASPDFMAK